MIANTQGASLTWRSVVIWALVNAIGWEVFSLSMSSIARSTIENFPERDHLAERVTSVFAIVLGTGAVIGCVIGLLGVALLRRWITNTKGWTIATALSWSGSGLIYFWMWYYLAHVDNEPRPFDLLISFVAGSVTAIGQWWFLRQSLRHAFLWPVLSGVAYCVAALVLVLELASAAILQSFWNAIVGLVGQVGVTIFGFGLPGLAFGAISALTLKFITRYTIGFPTPASQLPQLQNTE
jgi:hypothetical protein